MDTERKRPDLSIAIVVVIAGLLTGGVLTWYLTRPEPPVRYTPEYRVVDPESAEARAVLSEAEPSSGPVDEPTRQPDTGPAAEEPPGTADGPPPGVDEGPSAPDRAVIEGAREIMEREGVTEHVKLTEDLYVRLSAEVVIFTNAAQHEPNSDDVVAMQRLIADFTAGLLARHHVDPQEYYDYTQWVASDHERARRIGEKILRAAEKRAQMRIDVRTVPGIAPAPVAPPEE